ncbi:MAG: Uma2 family endonuclease, partial [Acidobacteria bacterium]|nr:Uma2 family endonuclease [Acidobacteriota bacterium]
TQAVDEGRKRRLYRELGVGEYWQYDPTGDYLDPALKGSRLIDGRYRPIKAVTEWDGRLRYRCDLGLELRLERDELRFFDADSDAYLPTCEEAFERSAQLEEARREIAGLKAELAASKR